MLFSRVLSGDAEILVSAPLLGARSRGCSSLIAPQAHGPCQTSCPHWPPSGPSSEGLLCAGFPMGEPPGTTGGFLTCFADEVIQAQRGGATCPRTHSQKAPIPPWQLSGHGLSSIHNSTNPYTAAPYYYPHLRGWHYRLNECEFEQTRGESEGQGSLACCSPWGCKQTQLSDRTSNNNMVGETEAQVAMPTQGPVGCTVPGAAAVVVLD